MLHRLPLNRVGGLTVLEFGHHESAISAQAKQVEAITRFYAATQR